jgi:hypothetical protein
MNIQLTKKEHTTNNDIDCRRAARRISTARFFDGVSRETFTTIIAKNF